jgi:hypothetical protein
MAITAAVRNLLKLKGRFKKCLIFQNGCNTKASKPVFNIYYSLSYYLIALWLSLPGNSTPKASS